MGFKARAWWMIDSDLMERLAKLDEFQELKSSSPPEVPECTRMVNELIEYVHQKFDLPYAKIVVGGFSQGAMVTTDVALSFDRPLGGLIVWSGTLICEDKWSELAGKNRFPIYQSHGTEDPILPFSVAVDLCNLFADANLDNVFTEFEGPHVIDVGAMKGAMKLIRKACL
jgi:phospholipase/carboxylesterase